MLLSSSSKQKVLLNTVAQSAVKVRKTPVTGCFPAPLRFSELSPHFCHAFMLAAHTDRTENFNNKAIQYLSEYLP